MSFTIFKSGYTISADDIMGNFYHVAQDNFLPLGGSNLSNTTGVYNLGDYYHRWGKSYFAGSISVDNVIAESSLGSSFRGFMTQIYKYCPDESHTATTRIGLSSTVISGDPIAYKIICKFVGMTTTVFLHFNQDTSSSNYILHGHKYIGSSLIYLNTATTGMPLLLSYSSSVDTAISCSESFLLCKSGNGKVFFSSQMLNADGTIVDGSQMLFTRHNTVAATLTSMVIQSSKAIKTGSSIIIYSLNG